MATKGADETIAWIITLFLLGAIAVLIIKNPRGFALSAGTVLGNGGLGGWGKTLTGSGYVQTRK